MHSPTPSIHPSMQNNKIQLEYENAYRKEGLGKGGGGGGGGGRGGVLCRCKMPESN